MRESLPHTLTHFLTDGFRAATGLNLGWLACLLVVALLRPAALMAQRDIAFSVAVDGGFASHGGQSSEGGFVSSMSLFTDVTLRAELPLDVHGRPFLAFDGAALADFADGDKICKLAQNGACLPKYPNVRLLGLTAGWASNWLAGWKITLGAGLGLANDTDADGGSGIEAHAALGVERRLWSHLSVELIARPTTMPALGDDVGSLWAVPVALGLRIQ